MRRWLQISARVVVVLGLVAWALQVALMPPEQRNNASTYGAFVLALAAIILDRLLKRRTPPSLDEQANLLALAMHNQWQQAALDRRLLEPAPLPITWCRTDLPVTGPITAATATRGNQARFDPLPGLTHVTSARLRKGDRRTLHTVYSGLASGRLVIVGPAGSGKSAAAVLLLLDALRYREQATPDDRPRIPIPVLFTLHDWDPANTSLRDWLISKLTQTRNPAPLLDAGRIAVILDGLDEMNESQRPLALRALSDHATFRLVLLTRSAELVKAAEHAHLIGAAVLELQPITPTAAADYLLRPLIDPAPPAWQAIADELTTHRAGTLSKALDNPLTLTLLRDSYPPNGPVDEIRDTERFPTPESIEDHLLDHVLPAAYVNPRSRYSLATAQRTLGYLAHRLNQDGTRDLAWWKVPQWTPRLPRFFVSVLAASPVLVLVVGLGFVPKGAEGIWSALVVALAPVLTAGAAGAQSQAKPRRVRVFWWRNPLVRPTRNAGLVLGAMTSVVFAFSVGPVPAVAFGIAIAIYFMIPSVMIQSGIGDAGSYGPRQTWRRDLAAQAMAGLSLGLSLGLMLGLTLEFLSGRQPGYFVPSVVAPALGLITWVSTGATWPAAMAQVYLAVRYRSPWRLIRFLEDARKRNVLRAVGPVYQFRHAKLQDRLAGM